MRERLFEPLQRVELKPTPVCGVPMTRLELKRMLKAQQGVGRAPQIREDFAEVDPQFGVFRLELHRLVESLEGLFAPSLALQRAAEARKIFRIGILPDGAGDPRHGVVVLVGLEAQQSHQMQAVGMIGIDRERLLAADLRIEMPSGQQMSKAGFAVRFRRACARIIGAYLGFSGCPAVAAVHRHISKVTNLSTSRRFPAFKKVVLAYDAMSPVWRTSAENTRCTETFESGSIRTD
jgi:hypothetical protein